MITKVVAATVSQGKQSLLHLERVRACVCVLTATPVVTKTACKETNVTTTLEKTNTITKPTVTVTTVNPTVLTTTSTSITCVAPYPLKTYYNVEKDNERASAGCNGNYTPPHERELHVVDCLRSYNISKRNQRPASTKWYVHMPSSSEQPSLTVSQRLHSPAQ